MGKDQTDTISPIIKLFDFSFQMTYDNRFPFQISCRHFDIRFDGPCKSPCCPNSIYGGRFSSEVSPLRLDSLLSKTPLRGHVQCSRVCTCDVRLRFWLSSYPMKLCQGGVFCEETCTPVPKFFKSIFRPNRSICDIDLDAGYRGCRVATTSWRMVLANLSLRPVSPIRLTSLLLAWLPCG